MSPQTPVKEPYIFPLKEPYDMEPLGLSLAFALDGVQEQDDGGEEEEEEQLQGL